MRVAALSPHFVVETSPGAVKTEQKIAARDLHHLRVVATRTENLSEVQPDKKETEEGLRRLTRLIRDEQRRREKNHGGSPREQQKRRALGLYKDVQNNEDPSIRKGSLVNRAA